MKIIDNREIYMEVRFGDLEGGDTFTYTTDANDCRPLYMIKVYNHNGNGEAVDLEFGTVHYFDSDELVIPIEFQGEAKWPTKVVRRK